MDNRFLQDRDEKQRLNHPILLFLLLSVTAHLLLFYFIKIDVLSTPADNLVKVRFTSASDASSRPISRSEKRKKKNNKEKKQPKQVVDIARPDTQKKPKKAQFSSQYNNTVEKETASEFDRSITRRSRKLTRNGSEKIPRRKRPTIGERTVQKEGKDPSRSAEKQKIKQGRRKGFTGSGGDLARGGEHAVSGLLKGDSEKNITGKKYAGGTPVPQQYLLKHNTDNIEISSPSNDYFRNVDKGNTTDVNTKKFIFADYFNRVKEAVSFYWNPMQVYVINDPRGNIYGRNNRYTKLRITLNHSGALTEIKILEASGADFLDREAVNAFKNAAPFPNPPEQLLEDDRMSFGFGFFVKYTE